MALEVVRALDQDVPVVVEIAVRVVVNVHQGAKDVPVPAKLLVVVAVLVTAQDHVVVITHLPLIAQMVRMNHTRVVTNAKDRVV